jgi:hypothetical protein
MITHFINWVKGLFSKKEEPIILEEIKEEIQEVVKPQRAEHCTSHNRFKKSCRPCNAAIAGLTY